MQHIIAIAQPRDFQTGQRFAMLDQSQQVCNDLARVAAIGQTIDDRDRGIGRQFLDLGVIVRADHDCIDHPAEHPCGVGNAFPAAQLHTACFHDNRATTQLPHRHVETDARAGGAFLENHRQHMACQRCVGIRFALGPVTACSLAIYRITDHRGNRIPAGIRKVEKMPNCHQAASGMT